MNDALVPDDPQRDLEERVRQTTPARLLIGRTGGCYRTTTQLELRRDHAAAVDAVWRSLDPIRDWGAEFVGEWRLFEVTTAATSKEEYLRRPDLGRQFSRDSRARLTSECPAGADLQIVVGDGLSAAAVALQVPRVLPALFESARHHGWTAGRPFVVRHCRVGLLNEIGDLLRPKLVVLLIGERPGLATAESLSAYLAFEPRPGDTDARRNLISNIHDRGVAPGDAVPRIVALAARMLQARASGVAVKEELSLGNELTAFPAESKNPIRDARFVNVVRELNEKLP